MWTVQFYRTFNLPTDKRSFPPLKKDISHNSNLYLRQHSHLPLNPHSVFVTMRIKSFIFNRVFRDSKISELKFFFFWKLRSRGRSVRRNALFQRQTLGMDHDRKTPIRSTLQFDIKSLKVQLAVFRFVAFSIRVTL